MNIKMKEQIDDEILYLPEDQFVIAVTKEDRKILLKLSDVILVEPAKQLENFKIEEELQKLKIEFKKGIKTLENILQNLQKE